MRFAPWMTSPVSSFCFSNHELEGGLMLNGRLGFLLSCCTRSFVLFAALLTIAVTPPVLSAQMAGTGSVAGVISDSTGATVAAAAITLTDKATNTPRKTTSNEAGNYIFPNVPPGEYEIVASKSGFRVTKTTITVTVAATS